MPALVSHHWAWWMGLGMPSRFVCAHFAQIVCRYVVAVTTLWSGVAYGFAGARLHRANALEAAAAPKQNTSEEKPK
jgi:hypothetical protein